MPPDGTASDRSLRPCQTGVKQRSIPVPGTRRTLVATPVFDTYWRFACERQRVFHARVRGASPPWTEDQVLAGHRFTNVFRASDRVSQFLIRHVIYEGSSRVEDVVFRTLLFKLFNRIETWTHLRAKLGEILWHDYNRGRFERALDALMRAGERVYSGAYIMPSPSLGAKRKHANHLRLLELMMEDDLPTKLVEAGSLEEVYQLLLKYPSLGPFLAFQLAIDLNYSTLLNFSEMDFVVAGPGAKSGLRKCFVDTAGLSDEEIIRVVVEIAAQEFTRQELQFADLWGRSLQLIDCQNLFCEVDKYARVVHPEVEGAGGRSRIKQRYVADPAPLPQWYPPKWELNFGSTPGSFTGPVVSRSARGS